MSKSDVEEYDPNYCMIHVGTNPYSCVEFIDWDDWDRQIPWSETLNNLLSKYAKARRFRKNKKKEGLWFVLSFQDLLYVLHEVIAGDKDDESGFVMAIMNALSFMKEIPELKSIPRYVRLEWCNR